VQNANSNFMSFGRGHFDLLEFERLTRAPTHGGLAFDDFTCSDRHGPEDKSVGYLCHESGFGSVHA
jgi:hypothetical protein